MMEEHITCEDLHFVFTAHEGNVLFLFLFLFFNLCMWWINLYNLQVATYNIFHSLKPIFVFSTLKCYFVGLSDSFISFHIVKQYFANESNLGLQQMTTCINLHFPLSQVVLHRSVEDNYDGGPAVVPADCPLIQLDGDMDMNTSNQCAMIVPLAATIPNDTSLLTTEINLPKESGKMNLTLTCPGGCREVSPQWVRKGGWRSKGVCV